MKGRLNEALYQIIMSAQKTGGIAPTAKELGSKMGVSTRAAQDKLQRLELKGYLVKGPDKRRRINEKQCTEAESALFILVGIGLCKVDSNGRSTKTKLKKRLTEIDLNHFGRSENFDFSDIFHRAVEGEYFVELGANRKSFKIGEKSHDQKPLLKMLAMNSKNGRKLLKET